MEKATIIGIELAKRVFQSYDDIVGHCCDAWNKFIDRPWKIISIGMRE